MKNAHVTFVRFCFQRRQAPRKLEGPSWPLDIRVRPSFLGWNRFLRRDRSHHVNESFTTTQDAGYDHGLAASAQQQIPVKPDKESPS
jgi:hypothetical protein